MLLLIDSRTELWPASSNFWKSQTFLGLCSLSNLYLCLHKALYSLCFSVLTCCFPLFRRTTVIVRLGPPYWPHFNLVMSAKTLFPSKVTFTDRGLRRLQIFLGDTDQPIKGACGDTCKAALCLHVPGCKVKVLMVFCYWIVVRIPWGHAWCSTWLMALITSHFQSFGFTS